MDKLVKYKDSTKVFEKSTYTWDLVHFARLREIHKTGSCATSPVFPEEKRKHKWYMTLYPNGAKGSADHLSLYLHLSESKTNNIFATWTFYLLKENDTILTQTEMDYVFKNDDCHGTPKFFSQEELISSISDDYSIKIRITISAEVLELQSYHTLNPPMQLSREFGSMLQNNEFSDFVIKLSDSSEIPVHRTILAARSPVFRAMFINDTSEKKLGYTEIIDVDKETMFALLVFIYTGQINNLTWEGTKKLLIAADKYGMKELKQSCAKILADGLLISNVLGILVLADVYSVPELKRSAFDYILENSSEFHDVSMFTEMRNYPDLLIELVAESLSDN